MKNDNKKEMRLMEVISDIPDDMITSAANEKVKKPWYKNFAVLGTAAACICAVAVGGVLLAMNGQGGYPIKYIYLDRDDMTTSESLEYVPKWDERTITQQYTTLKLSGQDYNSRSVEVKAELIEERIDTAEASGYDIYTDKTYTQNVEVYKISEVSEKFAVAVSFPESDKYYTYVINHYTPDSLAGLVNDLNFEDNLTFSGKITCRNWKDDGKTSDEVTFEGDVNKAVWDILLSDIQNVPITLMDADKDIKYTFDRGKTMHIGISVNLVGYKNIVMNVDENGYLTTNILSSGKYFYIGEKKAKEFIDYVEKNFEGYIIKYVYEEAPDNKPKPENAGESSTVSYIAGSGETIWLPANGDEYAEETQISDKGFTESKEVKP